MKYFLLRVTLLVLVSTAYCEEVDGINVLATRTTTELAGGDSPGTEAEPEPTSNIDNLATRQTTELAAGDSPGTEAEPISSKERRDILIKAANSFGSALAIVLGVSNPISSASVSLGVLVMGTFVDKLMNGQGRSLWDQLKSKVDLRIGEKLAEYHMETINADLFLPMQDRMKERHFNKNDLKILLQGQNKIFPQNFDSLGFSWELPLAMVYYLPYMISAYHEMIRKGNRRSCSLANKMEVYKQKVILGMKSMMKKRYKTIIGKSYNNERISYRCKKRTNVKKSFAGHTGQNSCYHYVNTVTYEDTMNGTTFTLQKNKNTWLGKSWEYNINKIRDNTVDYLYDEVIKKINSFFTADICLEDLGCACPTPITKQEIRFSWPAACFGNSRCFHPAFDFDWGDTWCYTNENKKGTYIRSDDIDFDTCMPMTIEPIETLNKL